MGIPVEDYHSVYMLVGPPGTAKTTIAKLMGTMMKEERLLPNDRFISINGAELKGKYVGHSAPRTKAIFDEYDIIFIDEAYSITSSQFGEMDSFGQEAMAQLMIELEKHSQDKLVIFAGYGGPDVLEKDNKMKAFVNANPGLRSRISATISFSAYSPEDMLAIVHRQAGNMGLQLEEKADPCILEYFRERTQDSNFGNGREGRSFLENCMVSVAGRIMKLPVSEQTMKCMTTILEEDVKDSIKRMREGLNAQICQTGKYGFLQGEN
jgi:SpoVK/Ycf46/Vps4 family AAA+-type ATPase